MPRRAKKRLAIRAFPGLALPAAAGLAVLFHWSAVVIVLLGWSAFGWVAGAFVGWRHGWADREESLEASWGEDWQEELVYGHYVHMKYEEGKRN